MDVEVTLQAGNRTRAPWPYRLAEFLGLMLLLYGLASSAWLIAACGAALIVICYAVYRRRNPAQSARHNGPAGDTDSGNADGFENGGGD